MATTASPRQPQSPAGPPTILPAPGGSFLIESPSPSEVFTPEDLNEEQRQIAATAARFAREEITPAIAAIEAKEPGVMEGLLRKGADLGLMSAEIPEDYGGMGLDKTSSSLIAEHMAVLASFATSTGAHTGIGTLPLVWYGTEDQKNRYLPKLATCELIAAYALSESSSGSDAMNIRTRAALSADGEHYILNGEKHWITNAGIAGLFTVFAKIDGEKFSAFLIERDTPGLSIGAEEHKLGIRGSSTCPIILQDCKVPVENLLGEPGKGHQIAFNVLNMGRLKLAVFCVGGARNSLSEMIRYAKERRAFGKSIAELGLIQRKISASASRLYATECMTYRTVGMIDASLAALTADQEQSPREVQQRIEEYAVECSILKVYGSEMMTLVADELVATMAGYGYVEDYSAERQYRDARINRIFEGTNEINRLIITGWLMKRAMAGKLALLPAIKRVMDEALQPPSLMGEGEAGAALERETAALAAARKITLFAAGVASQRYVTDLQDQQEVMADLADMISQIYALESAILRARKLADAKRSTATAAAAMTGLVADEALSAVELAARRILAACADGDMLHTQLALLRRLARVTSFDTVALSRAVARHCIDVEKYPLS